MSSAPAGEAEAYELLERLRWGGPPAACPHCRTAGRCYYLRPRSGRSRATRTGACTFRRVWKCGACRRQFSALAGTIFEGTRLPLRTWIAVIAEAAAAGAPPPARRIADRFGTSGEAARLMSRRLGLGLRAAGVSAAGARAEPVLAALLRLSPAEVSRIRRLTPGRVRPRPQVGPSASYG